MKITPIVMAAFMGISTAYAHEETPQEMKEAGETAKVAPALATAMKEAMIPLSRGLMASEKVGKPISGKFEIEEGKLQLSIYVVKSGQFFEVIVDHKNGKVLKSERITSGDDLKEAKSQAEAMVKAKSSLHQLVSSVEKVNPGYKAVSVTPESELDQTHADLLLLKGEESKQLKKRF